LGSPKGTLAGIVPHAGWVFSGRTAGLTYAALADASPDLVFVFGGHMHPGQRCVCMPAGSFGTPIGNVQVHESIASQLVSRFGCEEETPDRFHPDNTIELQMPFLREVWPRARVVAVQVPPDDTAEAVGRWAAEKSKEEGITAVAIGSTDLTHYGANYGFSPMGSGQEAHRWSKEENDRPFLDLLLKLDYQGAVEHALLHHSACCSGAAAAAAAFAKFRGATEGRLIEHTTSHEVESRGTPRMWVGYASIVY
jgi:AmmeMemoRadiSam system protein B